MQWWRTDSYTDPTSVPDELELQAGPKGVALVRAWSNGSTDPGWGLRKESDPEKSGFMWKYMQGAFDQRPVLAGADAGRWNFAFIMRSMKLVCIDIDGKNDGMLHVGKLGMLPHTLAETSRSGDGLHLFYSTSEDVWDDEAGFAMFSDRINLEQGVDIRATGCVYHYPQQRWNGRPVAELPKHLKDRLAKHMSSVASSTESILKLLVSGDEVEVLVMKQALVDDLKKPIPAGRRNATLFAIGSKMKLARVADWEQLLSTRAQQVGLDAREAVKLVTNIRRYV